MASSERAPAGAPGPGLAGEVLAGQPVSRAGIARHGHASLPVIAR